jgi:hypothetical protein
MNASTAFANQVSENIYYSVNEYNYNARDLWLTYGVAIAAATLCTTVGLFAIWSNGAAYQNLFSTFLRTTRDELLQNLIDHEDNGAEPLPKRLAETSIRLDVK